MADAKSRYSRTGQLVFVAADGRSIPYLARRILPPSSAIPRQGTTTVGPRDRLDLIATRTLGAPLAWWRIADANIAMDSSVLCEHPGRLLAVPAPKP